MPMVTMTTSKLKPDIPLDEVRKLWDESVYPAIKDQKGYLGGFLLVSEQRDEGISVGIWESKEDSEAIEKSGLYQEQVKKFLVYIESIVGRKFYDVNSNIVFVK
jgi:hypothetical protein